MGQEMEGRFKKEGIYVYLWLIHVEVWQKTTKFCKAIILQLKKIFLKETRYELEMWSVKEEIELLLFPGIEKFRTRFQVLENSARFLGVRVALQSQWQWCSGVFLFLCVWQVAFSKGLHQHMMHPLSCYTKRLWFLSLRLVSVPNSCWNAQWVKRWARKLLVLGLLGGGRQAWENLEFIYA